MDIGFNVCCHDDGIFYIDNDKKMLFGLDLERITRLKHDSGFIDPCINFFLNNQKINTPEAANLIKSYHHSYYYNNYPPLWTDPKIRSLTNKEIKNQYFHYPLLKFYQIIPNKVKVWLSLNLNSHILKIYKHKIAKSTNLKIHKISEFDHHSCHASSSYFFSPFDNALCITLDGFGDDYQSKVFKAKNNNLEFLYGTRCNEYNLINTVNEFTVGMLYGRVTEILGLRMNSDEGKVEALAAFGKYTENYFYDFLMKHTQINCTHDIVISGSKELNQLIRDSTRLRTIKDDIGPKNFSAAIQKWLEVIGEEYLTKIIDREGSNNLCLSGGIFANVKLNQKLFENVKIRNMYVFPAMGDNGAIAGGLVLKKNNDGDDLRWIKQCEMPYWGPSYSKEDVKKEIIRLQDKFRLKFEDLGKGWPEYAAHLLSAGKIVGVFQGRMEYGPRALGNRSVLANPTKIEVKDIINNKIKKREWYQPFCPSILESERERIFVKSYKNKHMTCAFSIKNEFSDVIPAVIHIDNTARAQFVEESDNPSYWTLLKALKQEIGVGVVLNTSFNLHGRTMVMKPEHAIQDFIDCNLDYLIMEGYLIWRENPAYL